MRNLYLTIYLYIKEKNKLPTDMYSKQKINYYLKRLKALKLVYKVGYGVWVINKKYDIPQVKKMLERGSGVTSTCIPENIEGHGFCFKLKLNNIPDWGKRESHFKKLFTYKNINGGQSAKIKGFTYMFYNKCLVVHFPESYSITCESAKECFDVAVEDFKNAIKGLSRIIRYTISTKEFHWNVIREHYCRVNDGSAVHLRNRGENYIRIKDGGKTWLTFDQSKGVPEAEMIDCGKAQTDMEKYTRFFNDMRKEPCTMGDLRDAHLNTIDLVKANAMSINQILELIKPRESVKHPDDTSLADYFG